MNDTPRTSKENLIDDLVLAVRDETRPNLGVSYEHQCREQDRRTARTFQARAALMAAMRAAHEPPEALAEVIRDLRLYGHHDYATRIERASSPPAAAPFQNHVAEWMVATFDAETVSNIDERNHRFLEESLELVQSLGCTQAEAHMLVDYVFGRPVGEPKQETGGVMVTLAALGNAAGIRIADAAETELARCWTKIDQIRAKQAGKPKHSPLPGPSETTSAGSTGHDNTNTAVDRPSAIRAGEAAARDGDSACPVVSPGACDCEGPQKIGPGYHAPYCATMAGTEFAKRHAPSDETGDGRAIDQK